MDGVHLADVRNRLSEVIARVEITHASLTAAATGSMKTPDAWTYFASTIVRTSTDGGKKVEETPVR
ncbi:MAG TPA: hypothetical protein VFJ19_13210 [Nocardioidaceae bacterium]|nr:hypothetical protein [Nocardioidaceae bacterium]